MKISDNVDLQKLNRNRLQNVLKNRFIHSNNELECRMWDRNAVENVQLMYRKFGGKSTWDYRIHSFKSIIYPNEIQTIIVHLPLLFIKMEQKEIISKGTSTFQLVRNAQLIQPMLFLFTTP